jgi:DNA-binding transcriptional MerR regulator
MDSALRISEAARLLGVTPKTLRHYEKLGLIEPRRSDNEYRVYSAEEMLRLQRIRQLQTLGLSLRQIKTILDDEGNEELWTAVLETLLGNIDGEIERLEARKERIRELLTQDIPNWLETLPEPSGLFGDVRMALGSSKREGVGQPKPLPAAVLALIAAALGGDDLYQRSRLIASLAALQAQDERPDLGWLPQPSGPYRWNQ